MVSIHAPTKGATGWLGGFKNCLAVSIHAPTKGATVIPWLLSTRIKTFQSTLPRRERPHLGQYGAIPCPFQSTLPRRERLTGTILHFRGCWFQSTLPRRERRWLGLPHTYFVTVSIHAPTKGATDQVIHSVAAVLVSIHAPTKGATMPAKRYRPDKDGFNPRSHEGSDAGNIRAGTGRGGFNPRSHEGSDQTDRLRLLQFICFNPRSHEGSDIKALLRRCFFNTVSIHAPTKGATWLSLEQAKNKISFNPRSHEGSDETPVCIIDPETRFNPRSHEGSDGRQKTLYPASIVSIHAPTKGATSARHL